MVNIDMDTKKAKNGLLEKVLKEYEPNSPQAKFLKSLSVALSQLDNELNNRKRKKLKK